MTPAVLDRLIERSCEKVGIKPRRMHAVRKTYASILYEAGISEALIIRAMGHVSFKTTERHYVRDVSTSNEKVILFEDALRRSVTPCDTILAK